ncbi:hypothetical protein CK203_008374 [Vitis vinifera]|uniref:Endonuclease/exonuclease/phosphatase domain-containing protein n=1 Tax=Vitis vinifera TaxID=29760 RepID=A0A438KNI1_VITVI|nr:hypothetical protein CK203_008374 [Vitis vinifera]
MPTAGPEEQLRSNDVTRGQVRGAASEEFEHRAHIGPVTRLSSGSSGPLAILKGAATVGVGPSEGRAADGSKISPCGPVVLLGGNLGPCQAQPHDRGLPLKFCSPAHLACFGCNLEMEFLKCREKDERRKQQPESQSSMTDCALLEEASRMENLQEGNMQKGCWDLIEVNCAANEARNLEWNLARAEPQEIRGGKEINWEESSLAKFSYFLGFPTEGLEKEILGFFYQDQKKAGKDTQQRLKVDLLCIQETKIHLMSEGVVRSLGAGRFLDWRALDASGSAGGVLICWDKRSMEILDWEEGQFLISSKFRNVENGVVWVFTGVYGPFTKEERESMWDEFGAIRGIWGEPWCVGGDFNIILSQGERSRQGRVTLAMRRFAQVIDDLELVDLPLQGESYTWSGGLYNQSCARLDRFLASPSWLDQFSNVIQKRLSRAISDHFPILIEGGGIRRGPSPFRGRASYKLATKLKVESEKRLTEEKISSKKEAKEGYAKWVNLEEIHWRQLSRELWLREGDRNTGYFHRMAMTHRRRNSMDRIKINGVWLSEEQEVRTGIVDAFKQLLTEDSEWKADIGGLNLNQISQQEAEILELPFSEDEVHSALMDMNGDKALGLDGFTVAFLAMLLGVRERGDSRDV